MDIACIASHRIVLVSDAFREMVLPFWQGLGEPELRCHSFVVPRGASCSGHRRRRSWLREA